MAVYIASSKSCEPKGSVRCWKKFERKYIQEQQPNQFYSYNQDMRFVNRMDQNLAKYRISIRMEKWWWFPLAWIVDAVLQGVWLLYQCNFSEIFKEKADYPESCRNSKYSNRYLLWWHKASPGAACKKQGRCDKLSTLLGKM